MNNKQKILILGTGFLCGVLLVMILFFSFSMGGGGSRQGSKQNSASQTLTKEKQQITDLTQQLQEAEQALQNSKNGKDGKALEQVQTNAQQLFGIYYNYDQSKDTNEKRQKEAEGIVTSEVAAQLFPISADNQSSDYGTIQSRLNGAQVYTQSQTGTTITALVDCNYTVKAGTMTSNVSHYLFQVIYDTTSGKFTEVTEIGKAGK